MLLHPTLHVSTCFTVFRNLSTLYFLFFTVKRIFGMWKCYYLGNFHCWFPVLLALGSLDFLLQCYVILFPNVNCPNLHRNGFTHFFMASRRRFCPFEQPSSCVGQLSVNSFHPYQAVILVVCAHPMSTKKQKC